MSVLVVEIAKFAASLLMETHCDHNCRIRSSSLRSSRLLTWQTVVALERLLLVPYQQKHSNRRTEHEGVLDGEGQLGVVVGGGLWLGG